MSRPPSSSAAYRAGSIIHHNGPQTRAALFAEVDFGRFASQQNTRLDNSIDSGWLKELPDGRIDLSANTRDHYEGKIPSPKKPAYVGQVAAPRSMDLMSRPDYKSPPKRVPRADEPVWSRREKVSA